MLLHRRPFLRFGVQNVLHRRWARSKICPPTCRRRRRTSTDTQFPQTFLERCLSPWKKTPFPLFVSFFSPRSWVFLGLETAKQTMSADFSSMCFRKDPLSVWSRTRNEENCCRKNSSHQVWWGFNEKDAATHPALPTTSCSWLRPTG